MFGCGRFWQLAMVFGEIPVAAVIATNLAIAVVVSRPRLSFRAVAHAKSPAVDLRECGNRSNYKTENDAYQDRSHHGVLSTRNPRSNVLLIRSRIQFFIRYASVIGGQPAISPATPARA
jgi:hypothetical protein